MQLHPVLSLCNMQRLSNKCAEDEKTKRLVWIWYSMDIHWLNSKSKWAIGFWQNKRCSGSSCVVCWIFRCGVICCFSRYGFVSPLKLRNSETWPWPGFSNLRLYPHPPHPRAHQWITCKCILLIHECKKKRIIKINHNQLCIITQIVDFLSSFNLSNLLSQTCNYIIVFSFTLKW